MSDKINLRYGSNDLIYLDVLAFTNDHEFLFRKHMKLDKESDAFSIEILVEN